ncbi:DUF2065 domain-containing protein [Martelella alba]|uniref:DUF2065 domain-containing protein n=1 Tax=Martelella alba TaxID=2590451 RepID=A0A506UIM9_9HYPH|nr:DUF2065 domain-containing protein [Martelella alba]TPW33167.1 DUF2065 domain-containing protein [Martelella alba]
MPLRDIVIGLAFFLVIEGLVYALAPSLVKAMARHIPEIDEGYLRILGVVAVAGGVGLVWLVHTSLTGF